MDKVVVPFNDLSRIHSQLIPAFTNELKDITSNSSFVLGSKVSDFESSYASLEGSKYCIGVDNGTNAIELMLRSVGIAPGDEVITSAMTFIATIFAIERIGATAVLVDTFPNSPLLDFEKISAHVTKKTKAILLVTLHGRVEHLNSYKEISDKFELKLLIDGAQSHLGKYDGYALTKYASAISTSFYPGKNLGSLGEGGAVLTDYLEIAEKIKYFRDWGAKEKYQHDYWGGNFRLHAMQARFLSVKLPFLESWTNERKEIAEKYRKEIRSDLLRPIVELAGDHTYHIFDIKVTHRNKAIASLQELGISTGIHYPRIVSENKAYRHLDSEKLQNAREFAQSTLSLPLFPGMTDAEIYSVITSCNKIELTS